MREAINRLDDYRRHPQNIISFIVLADLHWGAMDVEQFNREVELSLFDRLKKTGNVDCIFIAGDLFDMKETFPSRTVKRVFKFLVQLMDYADDVFIIEGTRGHDALQTMTLDLIFKETPYKDRIHFYDKVATITYNDTSILFLPEEYIGDASDYYKSYFSDHFDIVIGHGMVDKIWYAKNAAEREKEREKSTGEQMLSVPVFSVDELCSVGEYIYFGHVHTNVAYGKHKRFKYVGPLTRWEFDNEDKVGYYRVEYDHHTKKAIEEFIPNNYARLLVTDTIEILEDYEPKDIRSMLSESIDRASSVDKLRVKVTMKKGLPSFELMKDTITTTLRTIPNVYVTFNFINSDKVEVKETMEERNLRIQQYVNTPEDERIQNWVKERRNITVSLETVWDVIGYKNNKEESSNAI